MLGDYLLFILNIFFSPLFILFDFHFYIFCFVEREKKKVYIVTFLVGPPLSTTEQKQLTDCKAPLLFLSIPSYTKQQSNSIIIIIIIIIIIVIVETISLIDRRINVLNGNYYHCFFFVSFFRFNWINYLWIFTFLELEIYDLLSAAPSSGLTSDKYLDSSLTGSLIGW